MEDKTNIKKKIKKLWVKPELEVIDLSQTQSGGQSKCTR